MRCGEREPIVAIPPIVRTVIVRIEPAPIVIAVRAEQVQVAVRLHEASSAPPPFEYSRG